MARTDNSMFRSTFLSQERRSCNQSERRFRSFCNLIGRVLVGVPLGLKYLKSFVVSSVSVDLLVVEVEVEVVVLVVDLLGVGRCCVQAISMLISGPFSTFHATDVHLCENHTSTCYILLLYLCSS